MLWSRPTRNVAAAYDKLDQIGTLEVGKLADLVILDADPLQDVNNFRKIAMILKDGKVVDPRPTSDQEGTDSKLGSRST